MRVVFFGTPDLALPSLEALHQSHHLTAVVCQPDKPAGRSGRPQPPPVKKWAQDHNVEVHQPAKLNDGSFETWLRNQNPEICCLAAYGRILKQPILDVPPHGFLNVHPSLLPKHRGPSPIQTAIAQGDKETGVTIMRLDAGMDSGDIVLQERVAIAPDDTTVTLTETLARMGAELLVRAVDQVESDRAVFTTQNHSAATFTKLFEKTDGRISWRMRAEAIHNLIRAAVPWPVAHCRFNGKSLRIHQSTWRREAPDALPGTVLRTGPEGIDVATGEGTLTILRLQNPGKRELNADEFLRGTPIEPGDRFEDG